MTFAIKRSRIFTIKHPHKTPSKTLAIQTALLGDWQNATAINKALLNDNPKDIETLNRLAFAFTVQGKIRHAKSTYKKVLEIDALNPIALKNIKRLTEIATQKNLKNFSLNRYVNHAFIEETGKTKIVELVNIAPSKSVARLTVGQSLSLTIKRLKIFIKDSVGQYLGMLPDDISKRLIKFIKGGNEYETYVRSANAHRVIIFIRETKKAAKFKDHPSFTQTLDNALNFKKKNHKKMQKENLKDEEKDEENLSLDSSD